MYLRAAHAETHVPAIHGFIRENPLGIIISSIKSSNFPTLQCTHIPLVLDVNNNVNEDDPGVLRGHLAKANPHAKALIEAVQAAGSKSALTDEITVIFNGKADSYVTPKFYTTTKPDTGKVVPTWNYSAAQAYGRAKIYCDNLDAATGQYLTQQVNDLTNLQESAVTERGAQSDGEKIVGTMPWKVSDAPDRYVELLKKSIIGIEIQITRLEAKFKMSQEMGHGDREGVITGFKALNTEAGHVMAQTVAERGAFRIAENLKKQLK